jgi:hypothetical protein
MRLLRYLGRLATIATVLLLSLVLATSALAGGRPLNATLSGANELDPVTLEAGAGDPDGTGTVKLTLNGGQHRICFWIEVEGIALPATGAHIHAGKADENGGIVVPLASPNEEGVAVGCVNDLERSLIKAIRKHPRQYYVNVHNSDFPGGAVRGQLSWKAKPQ